MGQFASFGARHRSAAAAACIKKLEQGRRGSRGDTSRHTDIYLLILLHTSAYFSEREKLLPITLRNVSNQNGRKSHEHVGGVRNSGVMDGSAWECMDVHGSAWNRTYMHLDEFTHPSNFVTYHVTGWECMRYDGLHFNVY